MNTSDFHEIVTFKVRPAEIYEALLDSEKHTAFSGAPANINREIGGSFTAYGGMIEGILLEVIPNRKIVQKWRGKDWPEGHYSIITFDFEPVAEGTKLLFTQTGIPSDKYDMIKSGWNEHYWQKIRKFIEEES